MNHTKIKICGITNLADARYAAGAGADFLGFILKPESPRYVEPSLARDIIEWVHGPATIGVFADEPTDTINETARLAGFDLVQLHGRESPEDCAGCSLPVIKVIHVGTSGPSSATTQDELLDVASQYADAATYLLLDTARAGGGSGGTGTTFDWSIIPDLPLPFFLAGGLNPTNVAAAIRSVHPWAVDVASGVEEAPSRKDFERIDAFIQAVKIA